jgi:acetoin utilization deacetylase AcuC-like enzyme
MTGPTIITSERMLAHDPGPGHPERPERLRALIDHLRSRRGDDLEWTEAGLATRAQIERAHRSSHVDRIDSLHGRSAVLDADTITSPESVECAYLAAGAAVQAVDAVMRDSSRSAFALVRPPGHHAESDRAMGFCLFNNVAVAATHAIDVHELSRVLIVDWDVHHGNGTQEIFWERREVLYFSTHQYPFYPGSGARDEIGEGEGRGFTINAPLPADSGDLAFIDAFERVLIPAAERFQPQLVLVSAGFDAHRLDPLAAMNMTEQGFAALTRIVKSIADRDSGGRLALVLEGGYSIEGLIRSIDAVIVELQSGAATS